MLRFLKRCPLSETPIKPGLVWQLPVRHKPERPFGFQQVGGLFDESQPQRRLSGAALMKRRIADDGVVNRVRVKRCDIGPMKPGTHVAEIGARSVKGGVFGLKKVDLRDIAQIKGLCRKPAPASAQISNMTFQAGIEMPCQHGRAEIDPIH